MLGTRMYSMPTAKHMFKHLQLMEKTEAAGKPVIDTLDRIRIVLDRRETRRRLHHMEQATGGLVRWSPAVLVSGHGSEATNEISAMQQALRQCNALICKPCVACGVPQSHDMRLVWDADSLPPTVRPWSYAWVCSDFCDCSLPFAAVGHGCLQNES